MRRRNLNKSIYYLRKLEAVHWLYCGEKLIISEKVRRFKLWHTCTVFMLVIVVVTIWCTVLVHNTRNGKTTGSNQELVFNWFLHKPETLDEDWVIT